MLHDACITCVFKNILTRPQACTEMLARVSELHKNYPSYKWRGFTGTRNPGDGDAHLSATLLMIGTVDECTGVHMDWSNAINQCLRKF